MSDEDVYRNMVVEGAKAVFEAGLVQYGEGNVSVRVKKQEECWITPSQNDYANFTAEEAVHIQFDGTQSPKDALLLQNIVCTLPFIKPVRKQML